MIWHTHQQSGQILQPEKRWRFFWWIFVPRSFICCGVVWAWGDHDLIFLRKKKLNSLKHRKAKSGRCNYRLTKRIYTEFEQDVLYIDYKSLVRPAKKTIRVFPNRQLIYLLLRYRLINFVFFVHSWMNRLMNCWHFVTFAIWREM